MASDFRTTVMRLWAALGMPAPRLGAERRITLSADSVAVDLVEAPDEQHLLLRATAGRLSADPFTRERQLREILTRNLAYVHGNPACVALDDANLPTPSIVIEAAMAYSDARPDELGGMIEHVIRLQNIHAALLGADASARRSAPRSEDADAIYFRP